MARPERMKAVLAALPTPSAHGKVTSRPSSRTPDGTGRTSRTAACIAGDTRSKPASLSTSIRHGRGMTADFPGAPLPSGMAWPARKATDCTGAVQGVSQWCEATAAFSAVGFSVPITSRARRHDWSKLLTRLAVSGSR